jgi:hypothetical protein
MIRPFDFSDVFFLHRSSSQGLCFDTRLASTQRFRPVRHALMGRLFPHLHPETYIASSEIGLLGFSQYAHSPGQRLARLITIAPETVLTSPSMLEMLEALITASGARQAHYLLAESETHSEAYDFLRHAGFAVFARQTIWRGFASPSLPLENPAVSLRPALSVDQPSLATLFSAVVPAMVQQVEYPPDVSNGWSLREDGELVGFFTITSGALGFWVDPYFHPSARRAAECMAQLVHIIPENGTQPLFVCVRSYQEWLGGMLQELGFHCCADQSVLARRIVAPVMAVQPLQLQVMEGGAPQVTSLSPPASSR